MVPIQVAGTATVQLIFGDGSALEAHYWRIIKAGKASISSLTTNRNTVYQLSLMRLRNCKRNFRIEFAAGAKLDRRTGNLLRFAGDIELQLFNLIGYGVWDVSFPDGTAQYSNFDK